MSNEIFPMQQFVTDTESYIKELEEKGELDPKCKMCRDIFYPYIKAGKNITEIFAPRHKATSSCRSGKNNHCTCNTCF